MNPLLIILIVLAIVIIVILINILKKLNAPKDASAQTLAENLEATRLLHQELSRTRDSLGAKIDFTQQSASESIERQLRHQMSEVQKMTEELVRVQEGTKKIEGFATQLQSLQDILKNSKQRGNLGEYYLESGLQNVLSSKNYQMQYRFANNEAVDAVIFVKEKLIPIDAKFSLENYERLITASNDTDRETYIRAFKNDFKKRIDETSKYVRPEENTMDFAFMFIPSEAIYYDVLIAEVGAVKINTQDLIEYAFQKKVLIVSPTTLLAFLQTVLQGLRMLQIEERAHEIQQEVGKLSKHFYALSDVIGKLGKSLQVSNNHYDSIEKEYRKIGKDIMAISGEVVPLIEKAEKASSMNLIEE